jgi:hypothetical protein
MNLAEQLVLLALDPEKGVLARGIERRPLRRGIAAAVLAQLALHGRLRGEADTVAVSDNLPDFQPLLDEAATRLASERTEMPVDDAVSLVDGTLGDSVKRVLRSLVARDVLHDYREAFILHRHPVRSMQALREVHESLRGIARNGTAPANSAVALAAVGDGCGVLSVRMTASEAENLRGRLRRLADDGGDATRSLLLAIGRAASA